MNQTTWGGHVLFGLSGYKVKDTMINGRFVMKDRVFLTREAVRFINDRCFDSPVLTPAEVLELAERINRGQA